QVIYFDVHGTLIDSESGIFAALKPLLDQSPHRFDRREALTLYFESEIEVKQRIPATPYLQILVEAHGDMARRLGFPATKAESSLFASSIFSWPLFEGAVECIELLKHWTSVIVAISDVDHETLRKTSAFALLAPHFAEVFTWDATHTYRPHPSAFDAPLKYHDALGIPRDRRCLVSNSLFRDLEPARELGIPAIWIRYSQSLAGGL
ncbi:HAD-like domain-containing protein, partial [Mycena vulgaris]